MVTVSGYYQLECEIRSLKSEIKEITASCDLWFKDAQKLKKKQEKIKELNNSFKIKDGLITNKYAYDKLRKILESK